MGTRRKSSWETVGDEFSLSYYRNGTFEPPETTRIGIINSLPGQRERAVQAILYALELGNLYSNPRESKARLEQLKSSQEQLEKGGAGANDEVAGLKAQIRGQSAILARHSMVEAEVMAASARYHQKYFDPDESGRKPMLNLDKVVELYDSTDELANGAGLLDTIHAMNLDTDTAHEAERVSRLLLAEELASSTTAA